MDPPPDRRLSAPSRSHGRRARLVRDRRWPGCRRAAADPGRRRRRRGRFHLPRSSLSSPRWSCSPSSSTAPRSSAATTPAACRSTSSTTCAAACSTPSRASTASGRTRCAPGRWRRGRSPTCSSCRGCCSMVPFTLGTATLVVTSRRGDAVALAAAHPGHARGAAGRGDRDAPVRGALFPATWSAQQQAADVAQQVEETVTGVRVVKGFGQEAREVSTLEGAGAAAVRRAHARGPDDRPAQPGVAGAAHARAGRRDRPSAARGAVRLAQPRHVPRLHHLRAPARRARPDDRRPGGQAQLARAGVERVYDLVDASPVVDRPAGPVALPTGPLAVELDDVGSATPAARRCSTGCRCASSRGDGRAGRPAGSGKSTVTQLLARFYDPQAGQVRLGGVRRARPVA